MDDRLYHSYAEEPGNGLKSGIRTIFTAVAIIAVVFMLSCCGNIRYIPVNTETVVQYVDSIRWEIKDSTVIIPKTVIRDIVPEYDTLRLEAPNAEARAWVDTTVHSLKGEIRTEEQRTRTVIEYRDRIEYRDSLVYVEKPIPVEVIKTKTPKWAWGSLVLNAIIILIGALLIWLKIH